MQYSSLSLWLYKNCIRRGLYVHSKWNFWNTRRSETRICDVPMVFQHICGWYGKINKSKVGEVREKLCMKDGEWTFNTILFEDDTVLYAESESNLPKRIYTVIPPIPNVIGPWVCPRPEMSGSWSWEALSRYLQVITSGTIDAVAVDDGTAAAKQTLKALLDRELGSKRGK